MKVIIPSSIVLAGCLASAASAWADTVIRIGHATPESSPIHQSLLHFQEAVEEESDGTIEVKLYPGGQIGSVNEMTELVQSGNLQMTMGASVVLTSVIPELNVLDSFFLFEDVEHARDVLDGPGGNMLMEAMEEKGLQGMGFFERGFRHFSTSTQPLDSLESFQGLRMRSASNPTQIAAWEAVGAAPMPLDWGEIYTSLQQGLIDGQESALSSIYVERFFEAQDYVSLTGHIYTTELWFTNQDFWEGLNQAEQALVSEVAEETIALQRQLTQQKNQETIELLEAEGLEFNDVDADVKAALGETLNGAVEDEIIDRAGKAFYRDFMSSI